MSDPDAQREKLQAAMAALETQRATLGNDVVDPSIAALQQQLANLGLSSEEAPDEEERKIVTILFADIAGFTALSEKKDPEEVRSLMNGCFGYLVPIVAKYDGTIDKFIGDEIMALFGAPVAHEDDAERALRAALEMMNGIEAFNQANGTTLGLHIGINTGPVIAGQIGAQDRRNYSVMGDAVNLAARLEDASSTGEIFVGPNTYRQTAQIFEFENIPPLNLKGKEAPVEVKRLIGLKAKPRRVRGLKGLRAALIGREVELDEIHCALTRLQKGRGGIVGIVGEAGLGKSRLLSEARDFSKNNTLWAEARALPYTVGMSYWLTRELLYSLLGLGADTSPREFGTALARSLTVELGDQAEDAYASLARLLDLPLDESQAERVQFVGAEALQARVLEILRKYVTARARRQPLVLVWEDLHWCDPSSLRVLAALMPLAAEVPLLLLCALRPDESAAVTTLETASANYPLLLRRIDLSPLTRQQSATLVQDLLKIENMPDSVRDTIINRAEGNPFFLEELLRSLVDAGLVVRDGSRATATAEIRSIEIPETIQAVLAARIDRLGPQNKQALQKASIIGRIFQQRLLAQLYNPNSRAARHLDEALSELQRREFIRSGQEPAVRSSAPVEREYSFKHAITHDVAYDSMLLARRRELHRLAGEAIEKFFCDRLDEMSAALAYHYERAKVPQKAVHYFARAAERAQATFANTEAIAFYRSALTQLEQLGLTQAEAANQKLAATLNEHLGEVLTLVGEHMEARAALQRGIGFVAETDKIWRSRLFRKIGFSHNQQHHYEETALACDAAEKELGEAGSESTATWWEEKVQIQLERMHLLYWQGMANEMRQLADQYRTVVEEQGTPMQRGRFFQMLSLSLLTGSRYRPNEECLRLGERAVSESKDSTNLSEASHVRFTLGLVHLWGRNFAEAIEHCGIALQLSERCGDLVIQARSLTYLAAAHRCAHHLEQARSCATRTLELATKIGMVEYVAMANANLAWVAWSEDKQAETEKLGSEALRLWHGMEDPYSFDWMALWPLIALAFSRKDIARAIDYARGLLAEQQHPLPEPLTATTQKAIESWENNQPEKASLDLELALQMAEKFGQL
jgi:class 3 adenylate cyclase/tetratricopeptide (TPR) repeat protein